MYNDHYLEAEYRCDFFVDENRKALWKVELSMLEALNRICEEHGLRYFLIAGGMLGAVRHQGFIPWDDDIDIGMLREDFDEFLNFAEDELPSPLFLQTGMNEDKYFDPITRIRDPRTTGVIRKDWYSTCNNGIFIEIFPFDNVPDNRREAKIQDYWIRFYKTILVRSVYEMKDENVFKRFALGFFSDVAIMICGKEGIYRNYDKWCRKYNSSNTVYRNILTAYSYRNTFRYRREVINDVIKVPFEYTQTCIPAAYDECLKQVYKNYMEFPPVEKRGQKHEDIVIYDPTIDYQSFLDQARNEENYKYANQVKGLCVRSKKRW